MRPFRSFLLLLIFLTCFAGLYYFIPVNISLPAINDFISPILTDRIINKVSYPQKTDTSSFHLALKSVSDTTRIQISDSSNILKKYSKPLQSIIDSLQSSKGQVRIMYYGDSQIEGDRITSWLRQTL